MRPSPRRIPLRVLCSCAALAVTTASARAPADVPAPVAGDVLVATRAASVPSGIVLVNALGGQSQIAVFDAVDEDGAFATSLAYPGDGFLYATVDAPDDADDHIVRIDPTTGDKVRIVTQTTSAGALASPTGIDVDPATGDIVFVQGAQVLRADPATGAVSGVSEAGLLSDLREVVVDATGSFAYALSGDTHAIVRVTLTGAEAQRRVARGGSGQANTVADPNDVVLDGTEIVALAQDGAVTRVRISDGRGEDVLRAASVGAASGIDIDTAGNFVIADEDTDVVRRVNPNGASTPVSSGGLIEAPQDVLVVGGLERSTGGGIGGGGNPCVLCGLTADLDGMASAKVKGLAKTKTEMSALVTFHVTAPTWTATLGGRLLSGTYTKANKKGTKAVLVPDENSVGVLLELVDDRLGDTESRPPIFPTKEPKLVFAVNRKRTKAKLKVTFKVETDVGGKTLKGRLKTKLSGFPTGG